MNKELITVKAKLEFIAFPKDKDQILGEVGNNFGITKWQLSDLISETPDVVVPDYFTGVGRNFFFPVQIGEEYYLHLEPTMHEIYGLQFNIMSISINLEANTISNVNLFLKGILTDTMYTNSMKIYTPDELMQLIEQDNIDSLCKISGIGPSTARKVINKIKSKKEVAEMIILQQEFDITDNFMMKLIKAYGNNSEHVRQILQEDTYRLIFDIDGVGFKTADMIALRNGMEPTSPKRIEGFLYFLLNTKMENGDSFIYAYQLSNELQNYFEENVIVPYKDEEGQVIGSNVADALATLQRANIITIEPNERKGMRRIYLNSCYQLELDIATHLKRLLTASNAFDYKDWEKKISELEQKQGWCFSDEQKQGIKLGLDNQVCLITGLGGTGKSSLVSGILEVLSKYQCAQCSLAGKAAARLTELTGKVGYTIHSLLGFNGQKFLYDKNHHLPYDIIVVDEISLIGGEIFCHLLEAINTGAKLILLGDMGQLESIGCMNLAADLYDSKLIPTVELTQIHRQAQKSGIITAAHQVRHGEQLVSNRFLGEVVLGELQDMTLYCCDSFNEELSYMEQTFDSYYQQYNNDIMAVQLISPVKTRGNTSVYEINNFIQRKIIGIENIKNHITYDVEQDKPITLYEGDKVLCTRNMYHLQEASAINNKIKEPWAVSDVAIYNGWTGIIQKIDMEKKSADIYFPIGRITVNLSYGNLRSCIDLGYAITCHKMQGSSTAVVIGILDFSTPPTMLTKELLYTMITRAETHCVVIGQNRALQTAVSNSAISDKQTFLVEMLDS